MYQPAEGSRPFRFSSENLTPPLLTDALQFLHDARDANAWIESADEPLLSIVREGITGFTANERVGTYLMRTTLHTWFHTGEINAIRQMLGHSEILFVGPLSGNLEWRSAPGEEPARDADVSEANDGI